MQTGSPSRDVGGVTRGGSQVGGSKIPREGNALTILKLRKASARHNIMRPTSFLILGSLRQSQHIVVHAQNI